MTKLRERIGALTLRSVLLLAALLALSQTASAWNSLALVKNDGSLYQNTGINTSSNVREATFTIDLTGKGDVTLWAQPYDGTYTASQYNHMYPSSGPVTVSGSTSITSWTRSNNYINGVTFTGGKSYSVTVKVKDDAQIESMSITASRSSQGGDDVSSKLKLAGSWTTDWNNDQKDFKKVGDNTYSCTVTNINGSTFKFKPIFDGAWKGANDSSITKTGVSDDGTDDHNYMISGAADVTGTAVITVTATTSGITALSAIFTPDGGQVLPTGGMPFYPAGVYGEEEFDALDANERFYYLTGHSLNNGFASPEWQMTKQADGTYTIDFTWNDHRGSGKCGNEAESTKISVQYYTTGMSTPSSPLKTINITDFEIFTQIPENRRYAGTRMRATYNPEANSLSFKYVTSDGGTSTEIADAFYLPYISLVGDMSQNNGVPTTLGNYKVGTNKPLTTEKWQNSWIQYDRFGQPVTSRDGNQVYINTQWPPLHNVMFTGSYKDENQVEHTVGINSGGLSFTRYSDRATGAALKDQAEFQGIDKSLLADDDEYYVYRATDFWGLGKFKIWSGWSGGANSDKGAEWDNNWNWGYYDSDSSDHKNNNYGTTGYYPIKAGQTVKLGNVNGDMGFTEPTYINQVYFFLNLTSPNSNDGSSVLYTRQAAGNARIEALANKDNSAGAFNATVDAYANGETTPKVNGVRIRVVRANETDPDNNSVSIIREGNYAASGELLKWEAADFTQKLGQLGTVTQATGNHYPSGATYYLDGVNYPNSGWYEYVMDVKFEGLDVVTVRSNPFYVAKVENTLTLGQLVRVNKQNAVAPYNEYDYITYSMGANFTYGVKVAEGKNSEDAPVVAKVDRLQSPSNASYADPDKATWTKYVLFYARRPWAGDAPDHSLDGSVAKSWTVTYSTGAEDKTVTATTEDAPLQFIVPGADISLHNYKAALTYTPAGENAQDVTVDMTNNLVLRIPTPRMKQNFFETHIGYQDEQYQDVTVAAADHVGLVEAGDFTSEQTYSEARVRHLAFRAQLEMPNADADLLALIPADDADGHYFRQTRFSGDEKLRELLADQNVRIDLRNPNPTYITLKEQDLRNWLVKNEDATGFEPIKRNLRFDFDRNDCPITFFERFSEHGVTFSLDPKFYAPTFDSTKAKLYRFKYKAGKGAVAGSDDDNWWKERIVLVTTPGIVPSTETSLAPGHTANVEPEHSFYAFKMGGKIVGYDGMDGNTDTNALIHYNDLTTNENRTFFIQDSEPFHWYAEMDSHDIIKLDKLMIQVAHGYIFHTERHAAFSSEEGLEPALSFGKAKSLANAPARAPYIGKSKYMAFVGPFNEGVDAARAEIQTSVEAIGDYDAPAGVAGDGFIDMISRGAVYTIDGRCLFRGTGRVDLEPGIYVIATPKASYKVIVK